MCVWVCASVSVCVVYLFIRPVQQHLLCNYNALLLFRLFASHCAKNGTLQPLLIVIKWTRMHAEPAAAGDRSDASISVCLLSSSELATN